MGWGYAGMDSFGRQIGYCIEATCDKRGCNELINRGLGCVCGDMHGGGDEGGCGRYYCDKHLDWPDGKPCIHRGNNAWGVTFCQLMSFNGMITDPPAYFGCACGEWRSPQQVDSEIYDKIMAFPSKVEGYTQHVLTRRPSLPTTFLHDVQWPATCKWCYLSTGDPDAHFVPDGTDPDVMPHQYICFVSPTQLHEPVVNGG